MIFWLFAFIALGSVLSFAVEKKQVAITRAGKVLDGEFDRRIREEWKRAGGPQRWTLVLADEDAWCWYRETFRLPSGEPIPSDVRAFTTLRARRTYLRAATFQRDLSLLRGSIEHEILHILGRISKER